MVHDEVETCIENHSIPDVEESGYDNHVEVDYTLEDDDHNRLSGVHNLDEAVIENENVHAYDHPLAFYSSQLRKEDYHSWEKGLRRPHK